LQCYKEADPLEVAKDQTHLTKGQQDLAKLRSPFQRLFSGELEKYEGKKLNLQVEAGAQPKPAKLYCFSHQDNLLMR